ncbi:Zn-ribbon domain-containing OB-fold protein [Amycolatopsis dongchuanensis]|uniref:ChsH2 C-terminal OB-fold domain-containing protein n=1 Tax=Amycolatopsis dongchuanensis TaxID=1070866 RepID=A0ABP8VCU8_9PSEU
MEASGDGRWRVTGVRCPSCGAAAPYAWPRCPSCGGEAEPAVFGPEGTVWSSTVVRIPVADRTPPYALAYVDLDDGPRILAHLPADWPNDRVPPIGSRVRLTDLSAEGDLQVEVLQ